MPQLVHQQAGGHLAVVGLGLDQAARSHHGGLAQLGFGHAVVQVAQGVAHHALAVHIVDALAGLGHQAAQAHLVQGALAAVGQLHAHTGVFQGQGVAGLDRALLGAVFAVQHVAAGHLLLAAAHQHQFHLVLDVLDVHRAAPLQVAGHGSDHLFGEAAHLLVHAATGRRTAAFHGQEGLGHGHFDLAGIEGCHLAVAADDLVAARGGGAQLVRGRRGGRRLGGWCRAGLGAGGLGVHGGVSPGPRTAASVDVWRAPGEQRQLRNSSCALGRRPARRSGGFL